MTTTEMAELLLLVQNLSQEAIEVGYVSGSYRGKEPHKFCPKCEAMDKAQDDLIKFIIKGK